MTEQIAKSTKVIDVITALTQSGQLDVLYKSGLLMSKATMYRDMYLKYKAYLLQNIPPKKAKEMVAELFKYEDVRSVYRAIAVMDADAD